MARKPENTFINSVHRHLHEAVYAEKMANPYRGGTPDVYYEGIAGSLWAEYKYVVSLPPMLLLTNPKAPTKVTALQDRWLGRAHKNKRCPVVILGTRSGGIIYEDLDWRNEYQRQTLQARLISREEIARWLYQRVMNPTGTPLTSSKKTSRNAS